MNKENEELHEKCMDKLIEYQKGLKRPSKKDSMKENKKHPYKRERKSQ